MQNTISEHANLHFGCHSTLGADFVFFHAAKILNCKGAIPNRTHQRNIQRQTFLYSSLPDKSLRMRTFPHLPHKRSEKKEERGSSWKFIYVCVHAYACAFGSVCVRANRKHKLRIDRRVATLFLITSCRRGPSICLS